MLKSHLERDVASEVELRSEMFIKNFTDKYFTRTSRYYRKIRDYYVWHNQKAVQTKLGFVLFGEQGLTASRTQSNEVNTITNLMNDADVFVDVGANVGFFTCLASSLNKPVLAIEPHPYNLQCLYKNIQINNLKNVEVFPLALSDSIGVFAVYGGGQGASLVKGWGGIVSNYETLTPVNTLDNIIAGRLADKRLVIKVDVEGHEWALLKGASQTLTMSPRPTWLLEIGFKENFNGKINPDFEKIFNIFWTHGYEARSVALPDRIVEPEDVSRWTANRERDFGDLNYIFSFRNGV